MLRRELIPVWVSIILMSGILLVDSDCPAQTNPCSPDPCPAIPYAVAGCTLIPGGGCQPDDFSCECLAGFTWQQATHKCRVANMAQIPSGCFDMGDNLGEGNADERPVHNVCISAFEMDVHEVTNTEYAACVDEGACTSPDLYFSITRPTYFGDPDYYDFPVIYVDWYQAEDYCTWAGKRLPTEAEWEYAARGGLAGMAYPWGNDPPDCTRLNFYPYPEPPCVGDTNAVGSYPANGYGLFDMAGNVSEWTGDWYDPAYYQYCFNQGIVQDPHGPESGTERAFRGNSWRDVELPGPDSEFGVSDRYPYDPTYSVDGLGFRCARGGAYGP